MGFFDTLLFGEGPSTELTTMNLMTPRQLELLQNLLIEGIDISKSGVLQPGTFERELMPGEGVGSSLAALEEAAMRSATGELQQESERFLTDLISGKGSTSGQDAFESFFQSNIQEPALRDFSTQVLPAISRDFGGSNFFSSERRQTEDRAREDLLRGLTQARSSGALEQRQRDTTNRLAGTQAASATQGQNISNLAQLFNAQTGATQLDIDTLMADLQKFGVEEELRNQLFNQILQAINTRTFENIVLNDPGSTGLVQSFLSGGGGGPTGSGIASILSKLPIFGG